MSTRTDVATSRETVVAVFHSHAEAQQAIRELIAAGFDVKEMGVAAPDKDGVYQAQDDDSAASDGAVAGASVGLGAGALWGLGIIGGVLPAIGPVIAGGALAAVIASAAGTAAVGGIVGALIGSGIPQEEAEYYHGEFERGRTIVTVYATGARADEARRILDDYNAFDYSRRESEYATTAEANQRLDLNGNLVPRREFSDTDEFPAATRGRSIR